MSLVAQLWQQLIPFRVVWSCSDLVHGTVDVVHLLGFTQKAQPWSLLYCVIKIQLIST